MRKFPWLVSFVLCFSPLLASVSGGSLATGAQAAQGGLPDRGWYVVRPGDTLRDINGRNGRLGGDWKRLADLNPDVTDPDRIFPGTRLAVDLAAAGLSRGAVVVGLEADVDLQPTPLDWIDARSADILIGRTGLRTGGRSAASLVFGDGATLDLTADSVIFLADGERVELPARLVEVVVGQTDVRRTAAPSRVDDGIEIRLGGASANARPGSQGLSARTRRRPSGESQVMLYRGDATVEAASTSVVLPAGTGTTVPAGAPPSPPEALPVAPTFEPPAQVLSGTAVQWSVVPGVTRYLIEQCADSSCSQVVERDVVNRAEWTVVENIGSRVIARVAALSPSGLDGYLSEPRTIEVVAQVAPPTPPPQAPVLAAAGNAVWFGDLLVFGVGGRLDVTNVPEGVALETELDGAMSSAWASDWVHGPHEVGVTVVDAEGRRATARQAFLSDLVPPVLAWQQGGEELPRQYGLGDPDGDNSDVAPGKPDRRLGLEWSTDGNHWWPLLIRGDKPDSDGVMRTWTVGADAPQILFRKKRGRGFAPSVPVQPTGEKLARVTARDSESAVRSLAIVVLGGTSPMVRIEALDLVGNRSQVEWALDRDKL